LSYAVRIVSNHVPESTVKQNFILTSGVALLIFSASVFAEVTTTETNNGNLVMQDIPEIPVSIVSSLNSDQNVRSTGFIGLTL